MFLLKLLESESPFRWEPHLEEENLFEVDLEVVEENQFSYINFADKLVKAYVQHKNVDKAMAIETIISMETKLNELKDREDISAIFHIYYATKAIILLDMDRRDEAAQTFELMCPFSELCEEGKATVFGVRSICESLYSFEGTKKAQKSIEKCIGLSKSQYWYALKLAYEAKIRKLSNPSNNAPSLKECDIMEKFASVEINESALMLYMADILREKADTAVKNRSAFLIYFNKESDIKIHDTEIKEMFEKSKSLYEKCYDMRKNCPHYAYRCSFGLMRLPKEHRNMQLGGKIINEANKKFPDSGYGNFVSSYYLTITNNKDAKLIRNHLEMAAKKNIFNAQYRILIDDFQKKVKGFNVPKYINNMLSIFHEAPKKALLLSQFVSYYLFEEQNHKLACEKTVEFFDKVPEYRIVFQKHYSWFLDNNADCSLIDIISDEMKRLQQDQPKIYVEHKEFFIQFINQMQLSGVIIMKGYPQNLLLKFLNKDKSKQSQQQKQTHENKNKNKRNGNNFVGDTRGRMEDNRNYRSDRNNNVNEPTNNQYRRTDFESGRHDSKNKNKHEKNGKSSNVLSKNLPSTTVLAKVEVRKDCSPSREAGDEMKKKEHLNDDAVTAAGNDGETSIGEKHREEYKKYRRFSDSDTDDDNTVNRKNDSKSRNRDDDHTVNRKNDSKSRNRDDDHAENRKNDSKSRNRDDDHTVNLKNVSKSRNRDDDHTNRKNDSKNRNRDDDIDIRKTTRSFSELHLNESSARSRDEKNKFPAAASVCGDYSGVHEKNVEKTRRRLSSLDINREDESVSKRAREEIRSKRENKRPDDDYSIRSTTRHLKHMKIDRDYSPAGGRSSSSSSTESDGYETRRRSPRLNQRHENETRRRSPRLNRRHENEYERDSRRKNRDGDFRDDGRRSSVRDDSRGSRRRSDERYLSSRSLKSSSGRVRNDERDYYGKPKNSCSPRREKRFHREDRSVRSKHYRSGRSSSEETGHSSSGSDYEDLGKLKKSRMSSGREKNRNGSMERRRRDHR